MPNMLTCRHCGQQMANAWEEFLCGRNPNILRREREKLEKPSVFRQFLPARDQDALRIEELEHEVGHLKEVLRRIVGYVDSVRSSIT